MFSGIFSFFKDKSGVGVIKITYSKVLYLHLHSYVIKVHLDPFSDNIFNIYVRIISIFENCLVPILRQIYASSIYGHLCHFVCHLDQLSDNIFKFMFILEIGMFEIGSLSILRHNDGLSNF